MAAGDSLGNVFIFQIPKEIPQDVLNESGSVLPSGKTKVKQFVVRDLHTGPVKCLEWSKNGMKLFSGDKSGNIVLTELDLIKVGLWFPIIEPRIDCVSSLPGRNFIQCNTKRSLRDSPDPFPSAPVAVDLLDIPDCDL